MPHTHTKQRDRQSARPMTSRRANDEYFRRRTRVWESRKVRRRRTFLLEKTRTKIETPKIIFAPKAHLHPNWSGEGTNFRKNRTAYETCEFLWPPLPRLHPVNCAEKRHGTCPDLVRNPRVSYAARFYLKFVPSPDKFGRKCAFGAKIFFVHNLLSKFTT